MAINVVSRVITAPPFFLQKENGDTEPIYYTAADMRNLLSGIISRGGALGASHFLVTQSGNVGMSIRVNSGFYMIAGYLVYLPVDQSIALTTFDANPPATRTHIVWLSVYDGQVASTATYAAKIDIVEDTGGGASAPPNASNSVQLATLTVGKNQGNIQNANITDLRAHGGMMSEKFFLTPYFNAGFAPAGDDLGASNPYAVLANGSVRLGGALKRSSGSFAAGDPYTIGNLPGTLTPARDRFLFGACSDTTLTYRLQITDGGDIKVIIPNGVSPSHLLLDGISYDLD